MSARRRLRENKGEWRFSWCGSSMPRSDAFEMKVWQNQSFQAAEHVPNHSDRLKALPQAFLVISSFRVVVEVTMRMQWGANKTNRI